MNIRVYTGLFAISLFSSHFEPYLSFLFTKKKGMPPKTLPEKSDVIVNTLKYFETLTLIVRIKRQENQLSLIMTIEA